jgi:hypothetical protein
LREHITRAATPKPTIVGCVLIVGLPKQNSYLVAKIQVPNKAKDETLIVAIIDDFEDKNYDDLDENFCPPPSEGVGDCEEDVLVPASFKQQGDQTKLVTKVFYATHVRFI